RRVTVDGRTAANRARGRVGAESRQPLLGARLLSFRYRDGGRPSHLTHTLDGSGTTLRGKRGVFAQWPLVGTRRRRGQVVRSCQSQTAHRVYPFLQQRGGRRVLPEWRCAGGGVF